MRVMVIGGGGREHAIIKAIKKNPEVECVYALPGNGGIAEDAVCVEISPTDTRAIVAFGKERAIDFCVVAPDDPLVMGLVDPLEKAGIPCFGPNKRAAVIEGSKVFAKRLMKKYGIPTAGYRAFLSPAAAVRYARMKGRRYPLVVKADGLALGKGVLICENADQAQSAIETIMLGRRFGASGNRVVIEEFLTGPEVSVLCFTDGISMIPMVASMDHKRALDADTGENTGGMGAIAPNPYYTPSIAERCMREIFLPTMNALNDMGRSFRGCLYFGLMLTDDGPKVIEYNCRFGDPEAQAVLPLLESDLLTIMQAVRNQALHTVDVIFSEQASCCVVVVSGGYPGSYSKGRSIRIDPRGDGTLYHGGTACSDRGLVTSGGRVIGATVTAPTLREAVDGAYRAARRVCFEGAFMRGDIGARALSALKGE